MKRPLGIYRVKRPEGMEDDVWIEDSGVGLHVSESRYRDRGYQPNFDNLPWRTEGKLDA